MPGSRSAPALGPGLNRDQADTALGIRLGSNRGLTLRGPFSISTCVPSSSKVIPPPPVAITTPTISLSSGSMVRSASASACRRRPTRIVSPARSGAPSCGPSTGSGQTLHLAGDANGKSVVSKAVIGPAPDTPAMRFCQNVGTSLPIGVIAPKPVTKTRVTLPPPQPNDDSDAGRGFTTV